ncbi:unnamed protein product [Allacma fusca]|uniref:limulus clotting factor C n=1 Tax=Allacma fusca TaxID=39272 RepID=A0A8J2L7C6_9HEXA|nr:unnamed protein product [Allacma fusca]
MKLIVFISLLGVTLAQVLTDSGTTDRPAFVVEPRHAHNLVVEPRQVQEPTFHVEPRSPQSLGNLLYTYYQTQLEPVFRRYVLNYIGHSLSLLSNNYPYCYNSNEDDRIIIESPAGSLIEVSCPTFDVDCPYDGFSLSRSGETASPYFKTSCGQGTYYAISYGNRIALRLFSGFQQRVRFNRYKCTITAISAVPVTQPAPTEATTTAPVTTVPTTTTTTTTAKPTTTTTTTTAKPTTTTTTTTAKPTTTTTTTTTAKPTTTTTTTTTAKPTTTTTTTTAKPTTTTTTTTTAKPTTTTTTTTTAKPTTTTTTTTTAKPTTTTTTITAKPTVSTTQKPKCNCGARNEKPRIVNGTEAGVNEFPWRCALETNNGVICGSTLISENYVLTAAHCCADFNVKTDKVMINCGEHNLTTSSEAPNVRIQVSQQVTHSGYDSNSYNQDNDVCLLRLSKPMPMSKAISPVCLPFNNCGNQCKDNNTAVTASGWGVSKYGNNEPMYALQKLEMPCMSSERCNQYYPGYITKNMVCTYLENHDTCQGDSGGGIDAKDADGNSCIVGVVSWGVGCAAKNSPGVYANVQNYLPWIKQTTGETFCGE